MTSPAPATSRSKPGLLVLSLFCILAPEAAGDMVFPGNDWQEASPETQGVDPDLLDSALTYLAGQCGNQGVSQVVVIRNGYMIWKGSDIDNRHNTWSTTKSFTSTVLGLLIDDSACSLDTLAADYVASLEQDYATLSLRHFATMTSGYDAVGGDQSSTPFDPATPLFAPGTAFLYWDSAMNQFGNVLTRIAGEPIEDLFKRRVADLIGMDPGKWNWGDWGQLDGLTVNGGAGNKSKGIHISARELARFGHLILNQGSWDGQQILSSSWVQQATSVQVPNTMPSPNPDSSGPGAYGFNWWVNGIGSDGLWWLPDAPAGTCMAAGYNNNKCIVIPEWSMVIVRLGTDGSIETDVYNTFLQMVGDSLTTDDTIPPSTPTNLQVEPF